MKNFFSKIAIKLSRFMSGRYGADEFSLFLLIVYFVLSVLALLPYCAILYSVALSACFFHCSAVFHGTFTGETRKERGFSADVLSLKAFSNENAAFLRRGKRTVFSNANVAVPYLEFRKEKAG